MKQLTPWIYRRRDRGNHPGQIGTYIAISQPLALKTMGKRILIVDDDQDILDILHDLLEYFGYEVLTLADGDKVFENIAAFHPNLILLDVMLGQLDGRAICACIKQQMAIPVIMTSGTHQVFYKHANPNGPDDFLAKPFEMESLLEKIEHQLAA